MLVIMNIVQNNYFVYIIYIMIPYFVMFSFLFLKITKKNNIFYKTLSTLTRYIIKKIDNIGNAKITSSNNII